MVPHVYSCGHAVYGGLEKKAFLPRDQEMDSRLNFTGSGELAAMPYKSLMHFGVQHVHISEDPCNCGQGM